MKYFFTLCLFIFFFAGDVSAQSMRCPVQQGKVIVKIRPDAEPVFEQRLRTIRQPLSDTSTLRVGLKSFDKISRKYRAGNMRRLFPDAGKYEAKHRKYGLHLWYEITISENEDPVTVAKMYGSDENVQMAEPRYAIRSTAMPSPALPSGIPDDPGFSKQWNFNNTGQTGGIAGIDIRLPDAWSAAEILGLNGKEVVVAVVDGGVSYNHEDLNANMWVNQKELNGVRGKDDDENGYVDDIYGYNFVSRSGGAISPEDHATHVAGIVAAVTNNGKGVSGVTGDPGQGYKIKVMNTQIMTSSSSVASIVEAYTYAADNGAVISQNSWGYDNPNVFGQSDIDAINYFIEEAGKDEKRNPRPGTPMVGGIVIFAAGNDERDAKWYPAYFDNVLAVAAVNHYGKLAWYSNYGSWIDISAPGGDTDETGKKEAGGIYSTSYRLTNKNYYEYMQGTSMACPHVSGVAALILSVYGSENFTPDMLRARLLNTTTPLNGFDPANASKMGSGLLNAAAALAPGDVPGAITDLNAQTINAVSGGLDWTVPSGNGDSAPSFYVIACSTEEITEENFEKYAQKPVSSTKKPGEIQQSTVTGLLAETAYYVAVQNMGKMGDLSGISNVATFTTRSNIAPIVAQPLSDITLRDVAPETAFYVGDAFYDGDGDAMTYSVVVGSEKTATARIDGDTMRIQPKAAGATTVTLTADDANSGRASFSLSLMITQNHAPVINGLFADTTLIPYVTPVVVDLSKYVSDPENDDITYRYELSQFGIVNVNIKDDIMRIDPLHYGFVTVLVKASDPYAATSTTSIDVTVEQKYSPEKPDELMIYPNPTSDILYYSFVIDDPVASVNVRIVNTVGATMYQTPSVTLNSGTYYYNIDLSAWSSEMYLLQYFKNGKVIDTKKVIKF